LIRLKVDLIVVPDTPSTLAAMKASSTISVVITNAADPVRAGLVTSLAKPAGNVTGLSSLSPDLITKRLEILKDAVPKLVRVALLRPTPRPAGPPTQTEEARSAALALNLKMEEIDTPLDSKSLDSAFKPRGKNRLVRF
jgi:putative tryptophan/tyrosine transport system substrate-binding protein